MSSAQFLELNDVNEAPENKRDKKRRDLVEKLNKQSAEIYDRRDLIFLEAHNAMTDVHNHLLSTSPTNSYEFTAAPSTGSLMTSREQNLKLYELSLERDAILSTMKHTYGYAMDSAKSLYEIERSRVEEEYDSVQRSIKTKLIDAIEEKKRKLKEEKDMEVGVESLLDATNFSRSTRTSRNRKSGNVSSSVGGTPSQQDPNESEATVPSSSYLGVAFEDILGSSSLNSVLGGKKKKTPAGPPGMTGPFLGLGRSINSGLTAAKDIDVDTDMMEIRKKRRRK